MLMCYFKRVTVALAILLSASECLATGWHDFELDIGDGYHVFRANGLDVSIGKDDHRVILFPRDYDGVGPVVRYITTSDHIFTKNVGRKPRNLFEGDSFQEVDPSREFFFIISKKNDEVTGPLSEEQFVRRPEVVGVRHLDWKVPKNPNFWLPVVGSLMFLAIAIPILAIKFFWISIPLIIGLVLLIRHLLSKHGQTR